jgi:hypothetical protein
LKHKKDNTTTGYRRLSEKNKALTKKVERDKAKLAEAHAVEFARLRGDLDLETHNYAEYRQTVHRRLHELHEIIASSFDEVKVQCLPFPDKGVKIGEMINWVAGEVKAVSNTVWRLNDNFVVLGIKGVLKMLHGEACQELSRLHDLAASRDAAILEDVPEDVRKLAGWIVQRWWKPHGLPKAFHWLEAAHAVTVSDYDN